MGTDDMRVSLDELQRLSQSHVVMTMITAAEGELPLDEFLSSEAPGSIQTRTVQVCRECFISTKSIMVAVWPCTVAKLLHRNSEMTDLLQKAWQHNRQEFRHVYALQYQRLGLHVER